MSAERVDTGGGWVRGGNQRAQPNPHRCHVPTPAAEATYQAVWQCECGTQWMALFSLDQRPMNYWKRLGWLSRRKPARPNGSTR